VPPCYCIVTQKRINGTGQFFNMHIFLTQIVHVETVPIDVKPENCVVFSLPLFINFSYGGGTVPLLRL